MITSNDSQLFERFLHLVFFRVDFLQRSQTNTLTASVHSDMPTQSYASDMRILMENMQALNVNHRQDDLLLSSSGSLKDSGYQGKQIFDRRLGEMFSCICCALDLRSNSSRHYTPQTYRSNQSQSNAAETSDVSLDKTSI